MRLLLLLLPCVYAYPTWFHEYIKEHDKEYTDLDTMFRHLKPKMDSIINTKDLTMKLHAFSDKTYKKNNRINKKKSFIKTDICISMIMLSVRIVFKTRSLSPVISALVTTGNRQSGL